MESLVLFLPPCISSGATRHARQMNPNALRHTPNSGPSRARSWRENTANDNALHFVPHLKLVDAKASTQREGPRQRGALASTAGIADDCRRRGAPPLPAETSGNLHVFLMLSDHLGSNTFIIDHATGELVEHATYQAYGATESNYRPERWSSFREPYKFTGKEEDVEVGLGYYGARYLSMGLGVWMSPDPVTIHQVGSDPNPYAYVHGRPLVAVDPDGRLPFLLTLAISAVVGALVSGTIRKRFFTEFQTHTMVHCLL